MTGTDYKTIENHTLRIPLPVTRRALSESDHRAVARFVYALCEQHDRAFARAHMRAAVAHARRRRLTETQR
jgi:hypothetical protein